MVMGNGCMRGFSASSVNWEFAARDLAPLEEAFAYKNLMTNMGHSGKLAGTNLVKSDQRSQICCGVVATGIYRRNLMLGAWQLVMRLQFWALIIRHNKQLLQRKYSLRNVCKRSWNSSPELKKLFQQRKREKWVFWAVIKIGLERDIRRELKFFIKGVGKLSFDFYSRRS